MKTTTPSSAPVDPAAGHRPRCRYRPSAGRAATALLALTLVMTACTSSPSPTDRSAATSLPTASISSSSSSPSQTPTPTPASTAGASTSTPGTPTGSSPAAATSSSGAAAQLPSGPLGNQVRWYVGALLSGTLPTTAEIEQHFAASILAQVPPAQLRAALTQVIASKPQRLTAFSGDTQQGVAYLALAGGRRVLVTLSIDTAGKITSLLNRPLPALPTITTPGGLAAAATAAGARGSLLVADGNCRPLPATGSSVDADQAYPLGSMFKLYVLGAVARAVAQGRLRWADSLTIDAGIRSLPSGELQNSPANTRVTIQQAATLMISISDNTAADALIRAVGADAVEAAVRAMGSAHPGLLSPFPTTRQVFTLATDAALRKQWAATFDRSADGATADSTAAQIAARRALIARIPGALPSATAFAGAPAGWRDGVEWFASATDICRAQLALRTMAGTSAGAPLQAILTKNPGIGDLGVPVASLAFKGGGDTGVLTGSWVLERTDTTVRVLVWMMRGDTAGQVPDEQFYAVAARSALKLLAR